MELTGTDQMASLNVYKKGSAILAGTLFIFTLSFTPLHADNLAQELFEEGQWRACRAECLRILKVTPDNHAVRLLSIRSSIALGNDETAGLSDLSARPEVDLELRCEAHFELAKTHLKNGRDKDALNSLVFCLNNTKSGKLFLSSTSDANSLLISKPDYIKEYPGLENIIRTASKAWPHPAGEHKSGSISIAAAPAFWIVKFYRSQISPALGSRCSLKPSCSAFAIEALRKHGITGLALTGDRMIREPDVVHLKEKPMLIDGYIKYADPVSDHDFWHKQEMSHP